MSVIAIPMFIGGRNLIQIVNNISRLPRCARNDEFLEIVSHKADFNTCFYCKFTF